MTAEKVTKPIDIFSPEIHKHIDEEKTQTTEAKPVTKTEVDPKTAPAAKTEEVAPPATHTTKIETVAPPATHTTKTEVAPKVAPATPVVAPATPVVAPVTPAAAPKKTDAIEDQDKLREQFDLKERECASAIKEKIETTVESHLETIKKMYHTKKDEVLKDNRDALEKKLEQKFGIKPEEKKQQLEENELFAKYDEEIMSAFEIAEKISDRQLDSQHDFLEKLVIDRLPIACNTNLQMNYLNTGKVTFDEAGLTTNIAKFYKRQLTDLAEFNKKAIQTTYKNAIHVVEMNAQETEKAIQEKVDEIKGKQEKEAEAKTKEETTEAKPAAEKKIEEAEAKVVTPTSEKPDIFDDQAAVATTTKTTEPATHVTKKTTEKDIQELFMQD